MTHERCFFKPAVRVSLFRFFSLSDLRFSRKIGIICIYCSAFVTDA